jgi:hypothetical protein
MALEGCCPAHLIVHFAVDHPNLMELGPVLNGPTLGLDRLSCGLRMG